MSTVANLPRHLREAVVKEFAGETLHWVGRPSSAQTFRVATLIWLFAVPWTAFTLIWEAMALQGWFSGKPAPSFSHTVMGIFIPLFGLPFLLFGLYMMAVPILAWASARKTVHAISDRRFVTMTVGRRLKVKSSQLSAIVRTVRTEKGDGFGTLQVMTGWRVDSDGDKVEVSETLYGIADVCKADRLLAQHGMGERRVA